MWVAVLGAELPVASFEQADRHKATKRTAAAVTASGCLPERDLQPLTTPTLKGKRQKPELAKRKCLKEGCNITYLPTALLLTDLDSFLQAPRAGLSA